MEVGVLLAGKYRVERVLGRGGQGEVVQATNLLLGGPVAMKFLLPEMAADPTLVQRFLREGRAAAKLKSEHVARVIDIGTLDTGAPFIVFEYLEGDDLKTYRSRGLMIPEVVDLMLQATEALAEAHAKGIIHRDIKPANLFVSHDTAGVAVLKILDFGISKTLDLAVPSLTDSVAVMGTPTYMSPEQLMSTRDVDHRSDIWSLGVVLYELLEGRVPYDAETVTQLAVKIMTLPVPAMTVQAPPELIAIVARCLAKDPAYRFQNMGELAQALAPFARSAAHAAVNVGRANRMSTPVLAGDTSGLNVRGQIAPAPKPRRSWIAAVAIGGGVGVLGVVGFAVFGGGGHPAPEPASPALAVHEMQAVAPPTPAPAPPPPVVAPPAPAPDAADMRPAEAEARVADELAAFVTWSKKHQGAHCPAIEAITPHAKPDPWGSPLVVTCTDQPADQIAGVISAGPDRKLGTEDDIASWSLAPERVAIAKGPHWGAKPVAKAKVTSHKFPDKHPSDKKPADKPAIVDKDGDGIPDVR